MYTKRIHLILILYLTNKEEVILLYYFTRSVRNTASFSHPLFKSFFCMTCKKKYIACPYFVYDDSLPPAVSFYRKKIKIIYYYKYSRYTMRVRTVL